MSRPEKPRPPAGTALSLCELSCDGPGMERRQNDAERHHYARISGQKWVCDVERALTALQVDAVVRAYQRDRHDRSGDVPRNIGTKARDEQQYAAERYGRDGQHQQRYRRRDAYLYERTLSGGVTHP